MMTQGVRWAVLALAATLAACATPNTFDTPTGQPLQAGVGDVVLRAAKTSGTFGAGATGGVEIRFAGFVNGDLMFLRGDLTEAQPEAQLLGAGWTPLRLRALPGASFAVAGRKVTVLGSDTQAIRYRVDEG